ncbi:MAG TPA: multidrug effflux MFS transporter [Alphaproteobacteria bacterium]|nr:multidrug effflux MFS transporter [Alphaproteobacteria bacterium]
MASLERHDEVVTSLRAAPPLPSVTLLVAVTALGAFSMHIILPALPGMARLFGTSESTMQWAVSAALIGVAVGQLVHGPLSDRLGRRPVLIGGTAVYAIASLLCAFAWSSDALIAGRALQAFGACTGMVVGRAIIRDCYAGARSASLIGYVTMAMAICNLASPAVGAYLDAAFGWRSIFIVISIAGMAVLIACALGLAETNRDPSPRLGVAPIVTDLLALLRSRPFVAYALNTAFAMASWFAFVAEAPFVLASVYGRPAIEYGFYVPLVTAGYVLGNFVAGRYSQRFGLERMVAGGMAIALAGTALIAFAWLWALPDPLAIFLPMALGAIGTGIFMPNAMAAALGADRRIAGAASGLMGFLQMMVSAGAVWLVGQVRDDSLAPMIAVVLGTLALSLAVLWLRPRGT